MTRLIQLAVLFAALTVSMTARGQEQVFHVTMPNTASDTIDIGPMSPITALLSQSIWVHNPTNDTMQYWTSWGWGQGEFYLYTNRPFVIPPHDSLQASALFVFLIEAGQGFYAQKLGDTTAKLFEDWVIAVGNPKYLEKLEVEVFQNQFVYHGLMLRDEFGDPTIPLDSMVYFNDQDSLVTIQTIFIPRGSRFTISRFSRTLPVTLARGESLTTYFDFGDPDTVGFIDTMIGDTFYYDYSIVVTDTTYPMQNANFKGSPAKPNPPQGAVRKRSDIVGVLRCSPNPAGSAIVLTSEVSSMASIEIIDAASRVVATFDDKRLSPEGVQLSIEDLPPGVYFVRSGNYQTSFIKIH